ncbi:MAG TPA: hypothetical protein VK054_13210 [Beutenbergiaceae bacterium]|nr:hypothetical protein [Beutenbergiaceae bacterium]
MNTSSKLQEINDYVICKYIEDPEGTMQQLIDLIGPELYRRLNEQKDG